MEGIFGILTVNEWLAILRIGIGLWWLKSVLHKPLRKFVSGQMVNWTVALAENHPVPAYGRLIKSVVAPNADQRRTTDDENPAPNPLLVTDQLRHSSLVLRQQGNGHFVWCLIDSSINLKFPTLIIWR